MKTNKLMLGNYYLSFGVDLKQVETLHKDKILIDFTPIPLTGEWLLKFGFDQEDDFHFFIKISPFGTCLYLNIDINIYQIGCENKSWYSNNMDIYFIHQLQNLYFALTNEELTFKS
jgi:hypothetical protein